MLDEDLKFAIGLTLIEGVGPVTAKKLIAYCGSAEAVFGEKKNKLVKIPDVGEYTARNVVKADVLDRAEKELAFIRKNKIDTHFYLEDSYPQRLKYCEDGPLVLFSLGKMNMNENKTVSIVGTRRPTGYGKSFCEKLVGELAEHGITVVSGLAYGIDISAHRACVQHNIQTIGVLAHGLDMIYPSAHRQTAKKMLENGGLLTEFLSHTNPDKENFPKRNRIVAGMTDATIVIETGKKGGSVITANLANDYNRDVFALPGRAGDEFSEGCNFLIKSNRAALFESAEDILKLMGWEKKAEKQKEQVQQKLLIALDENEKTIVDLLKEKGETQLDFIALATESPVSKISSLLLTLEFKGIVRSMPGKKYSLA
ncbi:MAG: DNA-processing protein DprA [Bacteroidota bacterium]